MAEKPPNLDAFTDSIINKIDPEVYQTFNPAQIEAMVEAISACRPLAKHPIDLRGILPLFFSRFYFVLLMGRDRRSETQRIEAERRRRGAFMGGLFLAMCLMSPLVLILLFAAYILKSVMGIDIFPDKHLWDFFM